MEMSLRNLQLPLRVLFSCFLLMVGIGYLAALTYLFLIDVAPHSAKGHERNQVTNWSIDSMQPYMAAIDTSTNKSIFMAWADPRYNVHLLAASLVFKW